MAEFNIEHSTKRGSQASFGCVFGVQLNLLEKMVQLGQKTI